MAISLEKLGINLRSARKAQFPKDRQSDFAIRAEIGLSTYKKMESGDLTVSMNNYVKAANILGMTKQFEELFSVEESWFED